MINSVAMVTNVTIVNIGKLVILATKVNVQQEKVVYFVTLVTINRYRYLVNNTTNIPNDV